MIKILKPMGSITMTNDYFANLVSAAAKSCFGVSGMATSGRADTMKTLLLGTDFPEKGVRVEQVDNSLVIELHISVAYGVNIAAIVKSIIHKVKYVVEDATGLEVLRVDVRVDDIA